MGGTEGKGKRPNWSCRQKMTGAITDGGGIAEGRTTIYFPLSVSVPSAGQKSVGAERRLLSNFAGNFSTFSGS